MDDNQDPIQIPALSTPKVRLPDVGIEFRSDHEIGWVNVEFLPIGTDRCQSREFWQSGLANPKHSVNPLARTFARQGSHKRRDQWLFVHSRAYK